MSNLIRRGGVLAGLGALTLASVGVLAPAAFADNADGNVKVSNTETVQVAMDASGKIDAQRIYEQLVLTGNGKVDIANPVSTKGLRNLDGFGGFDVRDGKAQVRTDVNGTKKYRSVSDFTKKLPLDIKITYTLDGKKIEPGDVVGKSGNLEVRYVVKNVTGQIEDVKYENGAGAEKTSSENVVIPMVGTLETPCPRTSPRWCPTAPIRPVTVGAARCCRTR
jgi:putative membrane protein